MKSCGPQRARAVTGTVCAKKNPDEISLLPTRTRTNNDPRYKVPYVSVTLRYPVPTRCPVKATSGDICALHRRLSLFLANNAQSIWSRHDVVFACVSLSDLTRTQKAKKVIRVPFLAPAVGFETFVPSTIISSIAGNVVSSGGSEEGGAATRNRKRRNRRNRSRKKAEENEVAPEEDSHDVEQSKSRSQSFTENANMTYQNSPNGVNSSHPKVSKDALQSVELQKATKQWFSEIDADDRAVALGFVDGPIFSVFSKLALSSSKPSPIPNPNAGEPTTDKPKSKGQYKFYVHVPLNLERSSCFSVTKSILLFRCEKPLGSRRCIELLSQAHLVYLCFSVCRLFHRLGSQGSIQRRREVIAGRNGAFRFRFTSEWCFLRVQTRDHRFINKLPGRIAC